MGEECTVVFRVVLLTFLFATMCCRCEGKDLGGEEGRDVVALNIAFCIANVLSFSIVL